MRPVAMRSPSLLSYVSAERRSLAGIAQLVEQRTENPRVGGSSPPPGIVSIIGLARKPKKTGCAVGDDQS
jgi:hypothetical protein